MRTFQRVLVNTLLANITTQMVWFGFTFWAYLESRSVLVTSILGGSYMLFLALTSVPFGTLIDRIRKKTAMMLATASTAVAFAIAIILFFVVPADVLLDLRRSVLLGLPDDSAARRTGRIDPRPRPGDLRDHAGARRTSVPRRMAWWAWCRASVSR